LIQKGLGFYCNTKTKSISMIKLNSCVIKSFLTQLLVFVTVSTAVNPVFSLTLDQVKSLSVGETDTRIKALSQVLKDPDAQTLIFLQALSDDSVKILEGRAYIIKNNKGIDPLTGADVDVPADAQDVVSNNRMRGELDAALSALRLFSADPKQRLAAVKDLQKEPDPEKLAELERASKMEPVQQIRDQIEIAKSSILLSADDVADRLLSAKKLSASHSPDTQLLLNQRLDLETDPQVRAAVLASLKTIGSSLIWGERLGALFTGISLSSILLLVALGLAITYGLMGVINMAHGELMMVGAYATYVIQTFFVHHLSAYFDYYLVVAVPASFLVAALVGAVLERSVLRFLYGRPLETLLATWGISLILMQLVRTIFGAQNVAVENPSWMSGGIQVLPNLSLPWNRMIIILFAACVLLAMAMLISKTRLGLFVRGVTQNRPMAACMGVNTARIDTYAFALGSGIAGLAGCALSQIGNVGPDLGQGYIVDAFMVVVLGGVGQLAGTVYAALGLGIINKILEGLTGAVLAKIAVLVFIVVFIQKRPQGLFAVKGRSAEVQ
jgi:urea transport system permease protein